MRLPDGGAVLMYTDGLIERRGRNIDEAIDFLAEVLGSERILTPDAILARIEDAIGSPDDDVALLLLSFDLQRLPFEVELPADAAALQGMRRRLRAWLAYRGVDPGEAAAVVLAVSEACNNAIEHAYRGGGAGPVKVSVATAEGAVLRIVVEDHGSWKDDPPSAERGRGIMLMEHLMDSTDIQTGLHGTRVILECRVRAEPPVEAEYAPAAP
jgi:anti-sigma regulatory factor (Ser/Thr protein kinase)